MKSPRMSFKDYSFRKALVRNKDSVKAILALIAGTNFFVGFEPKVFLLSLTAGVVALGVKLLVDAVDFWYGEITPDGVVIDVKIKD